MPASKERDVSSNLLPPPWLAPLSLSLSLSRGLDVATSLPPYLPHIVLFLGVWILLTGHDLERATRGLDQEIRDCNTDEHPRNSTLGFGQLREVIMT